MRKFLTALQPHYMFYITKCIDQSGSMSVGQKDNMYDTKRPPRPYHLSTISKFAAKIQQFYEISKFF